MLKNKLLEFKKVTVIEKSESLEEFYKRNFRNNLNP